MKKRLISILAIAALAISAISAVGCGAQPGFSAPPTVQGPQTGTGVREKEMITVTDSIGRAVTVPRNPDYVATLWAPTTQIVSMLGDSDKIVVVSSGNLRDALFIDIFPAVLNARVSTGNNATNIEELFSDPAPQVIFCQSALTMDETTLEMFEMFGVPLVTIDFSSMDDLKYAVALVGEIMGREEEAAAYNEYFDRVFQFVAGRVNHIPGNERKEVYHAVNELLRTNVVNSLPGDWIPQIGISLVGVGTAQGDNTERRNFISVEQLFAYDPPYIIINGEDVMDYIEYNEAMHALSAYKNNRIYLLPVGITRFAHNNSIETPLAMLWLSKTIYPELFEDVDIHGEVRAFYKEIFNADLSDDTIGRILSGRGLREMENRD